MAEYKPHMLILFIFKYFNFLIDEYTLREIKLLEAGRSLYQITLVDLTEISETLTELDGRDWISYCQNTDGLKVTIPKNRGLNLD